MSDSRWPWTPSDLKQLQAILKEFTTERYVVAASPGTIRNNGRNVPALEVKIADVEKKKVNTFIYREEMSNFRNRLKREIDRMAFLEEHPPVIVKPENSL